MPSPTIPPRWMVRILSWIPGRCPGLVSFSPSGWSCIAFFRESGFGALTSFFRSDIGRQSDEARPLAIEPMNIKQSNCGER
jgi:hypothetical protein